jgi:hypothetical protein
MRAVRLLQLALFVVPATWAASHAAAQDARQATAREPERKARAGEADKGFCARAAPSLDRLDRAQAGARLNQLLSRNDAAQASLLYAIADAPSGQPVCAYLVFRPAALRDGKKCRASEFFLCIPDADCRAKLDDQICEQKPGQWD